MLSEAQITRVWEGMLGAEIRAKYFAEMSGRYVRYRRWGTWFTLLFASSNAVALLTTIPQQLTWIRLGLAVCVTGTSIYLAIAGNIQKALDCSNLYEAWMKLHQGYLTIWEDTDSDHSLALLTDLDARAVVISRSSTSLPYDKKAMGKWQTHTEREHGLVPVGTAAQASQTSAA